MPSITVDIPDDLAANFETVEALRRRLLEDFVIEQRRRGVISLGRAAELLGLSIPALLERLGSRGLGPINATPRELDESWQRFSALMQGR
jgi:predicted HTH domain antitoxin